MSEVSATGSSIETAILSSRGRGAAARADELPGPARAVHRAILRRFAATGRPPSASDLTAYAAEAGSDPTAALALLARHDLVHLTPDGDVEVAYPYSGRPTAHQVLLPTGVTVFSMCALDALGIPLMINADATIDSTDPQTSAPISVRRHGHEWHWEPDSTVVVVAWTDGTCSRAEGMCHSTNFHTDTESAKRWLAGSPAATGVVLNQANAALLAARSFATLLA
jgi:alkylmercury lyase